MARGNRKATTAVAHLHTPIRLVRPSGVTGASARQAIRSCNGRASPYELWVAPVVERAHTALAKLPKIPRVAIRRVSESGRVAIG